jgi:hypothetical protein
MLMMPGFDYEYPGDYVIEQPVRMANGGPTNPPIYVDSKNDPRYRAYNDSLNLYNTSQKAFKMASNNKSLQKINPDYPDVPVNFYFNKKDFLDFPDSYINPKFSGEYVSFEYPYNYWINEKRYDNLMGKYIDDAILKRQNFPMASHKVIMPSGKVAFKPQEAVHTNSSGEVERTRERNYIGSKLVKDSGWQTKKDTRKLNSTNAVNFNLELDLYQKPTQPIKIKPKETITPTYEKFKETLPDNLRNTDESDYNMRGYWEALGKPASFDYSQPKEDDGYYHAFSRNPNTGEILKKPHHPTFRMALEDDINAGYIPYQSPDGKIFTFGTNDTIPENYSRYTLPQQNNYSNSGLHYSVGVDKGKIVYKAGSIGNMKTMTPQQFEQFKKTDEFKKYNEVRRNDTPALERMLTDPTAGYIKMQDGGFVPENNPYDRFRTNTRDNTSYINTNTQPRVLNTNEAKAQSEAFRLAEIQRQKDLKAVQDAEVKARMERMAKSEYAKTQPTTTENLAVIGDALGDKFRFSYEPNLFDDYLNPFVYLGDIAGGLANVPQDVKTGNYSTAASRIVNPLLMGAMAGYSSKLAGTGFVNELFNPGAGIGYGNKINEVGQFLTTQTPLKNAYKLNPYAFKPNPEAYYRMGKGKSFIDDVLETNKIRANNENSYSNLRAAGKISGLREDGKIVLKAKTFPEADTYWAKGVPLDGRYASQNYGDYMIEASNEIPFIHAVNQRTKQKGFWDAPDVNYNNTHTRGNYVKPRQSYDYDIEGKIKPSIGTPLEYNPDLIKLYKPSWLKGYKPIEVPRQLPGSPNAVSVVDDFGRGIKQSSNKIDQNIINNYTQREVDWLNSEEAIKRNMAATGKSREAVIKERDKIFKQIDKTTLNILDDKADLATGVYVSDKNNPFINLFNIGNEELMLNAADHEIKHAISQQAIRSADSLIDLVTNPYKKYPTFNVKKRYDYLIPGETISKWASNAPEQQVVSKRIMDLVEKTQGIKRGTQLTDDNIKGVIDLLNKEIQNGNLQNSDIIAMLSSFKSKFGKNYYPKIKDMVNNAYGLAPTIGLGAGLYSQQQTPEKMQKGGFIPEQNPYDKFRTNTTDNTQFIQPQQRVLTKEEALKQSEAFKRAEVQRQKDVKSKQDAETASRIIGRADFNKAIQNPTTIDNLGVIGDELGNTFRAYPFEPDMFDDYINPGVQAGDMIGGLLRTPKNIREGNYGQVALDLAVPALTLAGARGARNVFGAANEMFNPIAGIENFGKYISNNTALNTIPQAKNFREVIGTLKGIPTERSLPRLSQDELKAFRNVQQIGRMKDTNKLLNEQMRYALDMNLPDTHFEKIFNYSKDEAKKFIEGLDDYSRINNNTQSIDLRRNNRFNINNNNRNDVFREGLITPHFDEVSDAEPFLVEISGNEAIGIPNQIVSPSQTEDFDLSYLVNTSEENLTDRYSNIRIPRQPYRNAMYQTLSNDWNRYVDRKTPTSEIISNRLDRVVSNYPLYKGNIIENVPGLHLANTNSLKNVSEKVNFQSKKNVGSGDVFTGSLNTSHSSYLPQLKQVFKYTNGTPQFLGYKPMNMMGYLSNYDYSPDEIAKYLNTEIDEQISRGIIPKNIQRPYNLKNTDSVLLPQYGIKQFQSGGEAEFNFNVYRDYVNGVFDNTPKETEAKKIYDKLNNMYYRTAKENNTNPVNYIMTHLIGANKKVN